jgi:hypothetical protein
MKSFLPVLIIVILLAGAILLITSNPKEKAPAPTQSTETPAAPPAPQTRTEHSAPPTHARPTPQPGPVAVAPPDAIEIIREGGKDAPPPPEINDPAWKNLSPTDQEKLEKQLRELEAEKLGSMKLPHRIAGIASRGTAVDIHMVLTLLAKPETEHSALAALGLVRNPHAKADIAATIKPKITDPRMDISFAAVRSYSQLLGDGAIPEVQQYIARGWQAHNGYELHVCTAGVKALAENKTPAGAMAIASLLNDAPRPEWLPDYGTEIVAAMEQLARYASLKEAAGQPTELLTVRDIAIKALDDYAEALRRKMPDSTNPPGRQYYQEKINEALTLSRNIMENTFADKPTPPR